MLQVIHRSNVMWLIVATLTTVASGRTYYVSTKGNDSADGLSERTAWRTIAHAAKVAKAGDTVLVLPGDYGAEQVIFAHSGKEGKPIILKGYRGRPTLRSDSGPAGKKDGGKIAFNITGRSHIRIEGFEIIGYGGYRVRVSKSSYIHVRDMFCPGRGGDICFANGVHHSVMDNCYIEDSYRNSLFIYGDPYWRLKPCTFNTITNCVVVRGGHSSIDVHTGCPDSYVVGNIIRERGKERNGRTATAGLYLHNHHIDRLHAIGNSVCNVYWGLELQGATKSLIADNLMFNFAKADLDYGSFPTEGFPNEPCADNIVQDNILFDANVPSRDAMGVIRLYGAQNITLLRNYVDGGKRKVDYESHRSHHIDSNGLIIDPIRGMQRIRITHGGFRLTYSPGLWPVGTIFRLIRKDGKVFQKKMVSGGVDFGILRAGLYNVEVILPGKLPAPRYLRVKPLPDNRGGAVIVWCDCSDEETGYLLERKIQGDADFKAIARLPANTTRYIDRSVGKSKAYYRIRAIYGDRKSACSNVDEIVRYGYWFTNRTGLAADGAAFAQVEKGKLKRLIVCQARRVERKRDAIEGLSAFAILEAGMRHIPWSMPSRNKGKKELWLLSSKPITATLRWSIDGIYGFIDCKGKYWLKLTTTGRAVKSATFNGKVVKVGYDEKTGCLHMNLLGSGMLAVNLAGD